MFLRKYETVALVNPDAGDAAVEKVVGRMREAIEKTGGKEVRFEDWGRRRTAHKLQRHNRTKAQYLYIQYLGRNDTVRELERLLKITEDAMLWQTIFLEDRVDPEAFDFAGESGKLTIQAARKDDIAREEAEREAREAQLRAAAEAAALGLHVEPPPAEEEKFEEEGFGFEDEEDVEDDEEDIR
jgi:ribosomal protein S6